MLTEVVEVSTGARMSRSPRVGEFMEIDRHGKPRYFTFGDMMGTTLFESPEKANNWIEEHGLGATHEPRPAYQGNLGRG